MDNLQTPADKTPIKVNIIVPMILFLMIFSLVIDNSFKIISPELVNYFGVSASTVSWQVTFIWIGNWYWSCSICSII